MYPRNAASPPEISVGSLVSTADGSLATTGASVRVKSGGSWAAGAGTLNCDATSGIWSYVPTQAESNATHFIVAVYRSGYVSIERTVVTTVSDVAGYAGLDWSQVRAATTTVTLSGTTISTGQAVASVTGAVGSVTAAVTAGTVTDKTGYSLTQAFPANFATLGINASGHVSRVTLVDTTTTNTDMRGTDSAALATHWTSTRAGYLDSVLLAANSNQRTVQVTGSNHVAADIHELQAGVITDAAFSAGWLTAAGTAADYVTELQTALGTATNQTAILDRVSFALSALVGACSDAQTAAETYVLSIGGNTYTLDYSGLDGSGNRGTTTLSKV